MAVGQWTGLRERREVRREVPVVVRKGNLERITEPRGELAGEAPFFFKKIRSCSRPVKMIRIILNLYRHIKICNCCYFTISDIL